MVPTTADGAVTGTRADGGAHEERTAEEASYEGDNGDEAKHAHDVEDTPNNPTAGSPFGPTCSTPPRSPLRSGARLK